jgi:type II secretory pathway component PulM
VAAVKPEEIDIEALLEAERDRARSEAKPAIADLVRAKTENDKKMIMWGGVTFFMILISVIWIYNLNTVFKKTAAQAGSSPTSDWKKATEDISKQMEEMQADLENIQEFTETATSAPAAIIPAGEARAIVPASSSPVDAENIELLKEKIEGAAETNKIN